MPKRIQRRRTKGWKMPEGAVFVGRPTKWGNPYLKGPGPMGVSNQELVDEYKIYLEFTNQGNDIALQAKKLLRGMDLVCWCPLDQPCHADVLLEIANS